ncbi:MAG: FAD-binding protein, partial [Proteobacteria bacterium]
MAKTPLFTFITDCLQSTARIDDDPQRLTRRELLQRSVTAGLALAYAPVFINLARADSPLSRPRLRTDDPVTILGGGVAGLTAAYRLAQAGIACEIFEASSRFGGRMYTERNFNTDGMFCERGGELIDHSHQDLVSLCKELGLEIETIQETIPGIQEELFFISGKFRTRDELKRAFKPLAKRIREAHREIFGQHAVESPTYLNPFNAARYDRMSIEQFLDSLKNDVDSWVLSLIRVAYVGEMGLEAGEQSALNLLLLISADENIPAVLGDSDQSNRIKGGSGSLPDRLVEQIKPVVPLQAGKQLIKIKDTGSQFKLTFLEAGKTTELSATQIICTLPFSVLRTIEGVRELGLSPVKQRCISELGYGTNSKFMMGFKSKFWRAESLARAPSNGLIYS